MHRKEKANFEIGDIVNMRCGEQGIVLEILDDDFVYLLQCDGHVEKYCTYDMWHSKNEQNGKEALHELFMKTLGYSGIYEEKTSEESEFLVPNNEDEIPF